MKGNIKQVAYMDTNKPGDWWVWDAYCDDCGKHFRNYDTYSNKKPDENKKDYCLSCLQKRIDEIIDSQN